MPNRISIFSGFKVCRNGGAYGTKINHKNMDKVFLNLWFLFFCFFTISVNGDMEYYPG